VLSGLLQQLGLDRAIQQLTLFRLWGRVVPSRIRERAGIEDFRAGRLYLRVEDPIWMHELHMLRHQLRAKLNQAADEPLVEEIVLRIGPVDRGVREARSCSTDPRSVARPLASQVTFAVPIAQLLEPVRDGPCREAIERLFRRWAARLV
jgi:hypothetical protein